MKSLKRSHYLDTLQASLKDWSAHIDAFEQQVRDAKNKQNRRDYERHIEELRLRHAEVERRLREFVIENEDDAAWEGLRMAVEDAVGLFKNAFERASKKFKELV